MSYCEDYPCCGHGPPPLGDGGGCPDEQGRFKCTECGARMPRGHTSAICTGCREMLARMSPEERDDYFERRDRYADDY